MNKKEIIDELKKQRINYSYSGKEKTFFVDKKVIGMVTYHEDSDISIIGERNYNKKGKVKLRQLTHRTGQHKKPQTLVLMSKKDNVLASKQPKGCEEVIKYDTRTIPKPRPFVSNKEKPMKRLRHINKSY